MSYATVVVRDKLGKTGTMKVECNSACTMSKVSDFADWLKTHTDAAVIGYGLHMGVSGDSTTEGKYNLVTSGLALLYLDNATGKSVRGTVLAPAEQDISDKEQPNSNFAKDYRQELEKLNGKSLTYNGGGVKARLPKSEARDKVESGV